MEISIRKILICLVVLVGIFSQSFAGRQSKCGLTCFSWKKCKGNLSKLTNTGGDHRPGQSGTTGQLFFSTCGEPPVGCECTYEEPKRKPKLPKAMLDYVEDDAMSWLLNLVDTN